MNFVKRYKVNPHLQLIHSLGLLLPLAGLGIAWDYYN